VFQRLSLALLIATFTVLGGCRDAYEWNQKLTVEIDTPDGVRAGSSVAHVYVLFGQLPLSGNEVEYSFEGEATTIDLPDGRTLFALIDEWQQETVYRSFADLLPESRGDWLGHIAGLQGVREVPAKWRPKIVMFEDINKPGSLKKVEPGKFGETLGPGYALRSMTIEVTKEPVTKGVVASKLPWLETLPSGYVGNPALNVSTADFIRVAY